MSGLPEITESVTSSVRVYREEGSLASLISVFSTIVRELGALATRALPDEVGVEVAKYSSALQDALEGFEEAMEALASGNVSGGISHMYGGLRSAVTDLLPAQLQESEVYQAIVGSLDVVLGDLSSTVTMYQQRLLQAGVCWKTSSPRSRSRPSRCPAQHHWDGEHWCYGMREGNGPPMQIKNQHGICLDVQLTGNRADRLQMWDCDRSSPNQKWFYIRSSGWIVDVRGKCLGAGWHNQVSMQRCRSGSTHQEWIYTSTGQFQNSHGCLDAMQYSAREGIVQTSPCMDSKNQQWDMTAAPALLDRSTAGKRPSGAVPPTCDTLSQFSEKHGSWCYGQCPSGTEPVGGQCKTACVGSFDANSPLMCGKTPGLIVAAIQEMAIRTLAAGLTIHNTISTQGAVAALPSTVQFLVDLGAGFAYPACSTAMAESESSGLGPQ